MEKTHNNQATDRFSAEFASCLTKVLAEAAGSSVSFTVKTAPDLSKRNSDPVHFRVSVKGAERGECFIEMYKPGIMMLGSQMLRDVASEYKEQHAQAVHQAIVTAVSELNGRLAAHYRDLTLTVERVNDLVFGGMLVVPLAGTGLDYDLPILLYFSSQFHEALAGGAADSPSPANANPYLGKRNLDLVMDVELSVSLRFGQRQMALREVLDLESGSVIELDRRVDEPVELLLDGRVIATGEAVIVDGNYGLRVTKVPQPIVQ